ncbi:hypothetical protein GX586_13770 [bacterium]|nr:hypothetical protein [bacterium]
MVYVIPTGVNDGNAADTPDMVSRLKVDIGVLSGIQIDDHFLLGMPARSATEKVKQKVVGQ